MNRSQLSRAINELSAQIEQKERELAALLDDSQRKEVNQLTKLVEEREKLRGELAHKTRTMQQKGLLL